MRHTLVLGGRSSQTFNCNIAIFFDFLLVRLFREYAFDVLGYRDALLFVVFVFVLSIIPLRFHSFVVSVDMPDATELGARHAATILAFRDFCAL